MTDSNLAGAAADARASLQGIGACVVCASADSHVLPSPNSSIDGEYFAPVMHDVQVRRCSGCGHTYLDPRPSDACLSGFYDRPGYVCHQQHGGHEGDHVFDVRLDAIVQGDRRPRRILDIGCGGGGLLRQATRRGVDDVWGLEVGDAARAKLVNAGFRVVTDLQELPDGHFDAITMITVLEHIDHPVEFLGAVRRKLSRSGVLLVEVPNVRSLRARLARLPIQRSVDEVYRAFPIHLHYFGKDQLTACLVRAGYEVKSLFTLGLGVDESLAAWRRSPRVAATTAPQGQLGSNPNEAPRPPRARGAFRTLARRLVFGPIHAFRLGEHLVAIAGHSS